MSWEILIAGDWWKRGTKQLSLSLSFPRHAFLPPLSPPIIDAWCTEWTLDALYRCLYRHTQHLHSYWILPSRKLTGEHSLTPLLTVTAPTVDVLIDDEYMTINTVDVLIDDSCLCNTFRFTKQGSVIRIQILTCHSNLFYGMHK